MLEEQSRNEVPISQMSVIPVALRDKSVDSSKVSDMIAKMVILLNIDRVKIPAGSRNASRILTRLSRHRFHVESGTGGD